MQLTTTLVAEWNFTHNGDFERASTMALATMREQAIVDVDDLQRLLDQVLEPFSCSPMAGDVSFAFLQAPAPVTA
ncbi:hypothetical protein FIV34_04125 [Luteibacter pinisoli]|uniref:Uncharacterized protein n=1 Tax=Luteibacter pinisoli TaxID=2589080 RepID=A0A4Y5Z061_9GAMM|nr:hypothetical protein [Luteibacter pinisoli]QDE38444.1 hypothetical protein FIV34_04125 [Luteibacter pinisoli]